MRSMLHLAAVAALGFWIGSAPAQAPGYPAKPVRLIVPFPPGGSTDTVARVLGPKLGERLGQPVIIDNRPGAGGSLGVELATKAAPDGYTIVLAAAGALTISGSLVKSPSFDPLKDLVPITLIGTSPFLLVADPSLPAASAREVIALAKARPGRLTYASGGNGTAMHLSGELFKLMSGTDILHIPYKGSNPAVAAAASGQTSLAFADITSALSLMKAGRVKTIGVLSKERSALAPDIPTLAETGLPGYESIGWFGFLAPAGAPAPIISRLNRDTVAVMQLQEVRERMTAVALEPWPSTPEEFTAYMKAETAKWARVIKEARIAAE
ncbi:MAG: tripartite tricarboxylate transporter substrate binding protein [Betaproteobacteria bacterium]|nr:tripartite tricarboxylate transporter substrate binding protein [Betaproteobacteria bacterium]MBI2961991.1 tripartite tricarboxylate transporter substrate binding protein [Betaproteobacteria bacterium]